MNLHRKHHLIYPLIILLLPTIVFNEHIIGTTASKSNIVFSFHRPSHRQASNACFSQQDTTTTSSNNSSNENANTVFNHDCIGITNPTVSATNPLIKRLQQAAATLVCTNNNKYDHTRKEEEEQGTADSSGEVSASVTMETQEGWRIIRKRRVVGKGEAAYWRVRDAMLGWEGMHAGSKWAGIHLMRRKRRVHQRTKPATSTVRPKINTTQKDDDDDDAVISAVEVEADPLRAPTSNNVLQITSSPGLKRLTTFSRILPGIWAVNPCMVLYDLVDERSSSGMTYSATAYGTMRGHLLRGEERVCVSICDQSREVVVEVLSYSHATPGILGNVVFRACRGMQDRFFQEEVDALANVAAHGKDDELFAPASDVGMDMTMTLFDGNADHDDSSRKVVNASLMRNLRSTGTPYYSVGCSNTRRRNMNMNAINAWRLGNGGRIR